ncbi:hypothetical protein KEM52_000696, partial [Ascosphaera acerosa]
PIYEYIPRQQGFNRALHAKQLQRRLFSSLRSSAAAAAATTARGSGGGSAAAAAGRAARAAFARPLASPLRPNLTGGALPRTAGGYAFGGSAGRARGFCHGAARPAEVISNVSAGMRAFWLSGSNFKTSALQEQIRLKRLGVEAQREREREREREAARRRRAAAEQRQCRAGSYIDFNLAPSLTALGSDLPPTTPATLTLNTENLMGVLSADFARAARELEMVHADVKRLSALGDLPITMVNGTTLRVCFPGYERELVERLCTDIGVVRGVIGQDEDFEASNGSDVALQFPFAPSRCDTCGSPSERDAFGYDDAREQGWGGSLPGLTETSSSADSGGGGRAGGPWRTPSSSSAGWDTPDYSIAGYDLLNSPSTNPWLATEDGLAVSETIELSDLAAGLDRDGASLENEYSSDGGISLFIR